MPKKQRVTSGPNTDIDAMVKQMRDKFSALSPSDQINTIKVAISWEKVKHDIEEGSEGEFFNDDD